MTGANLTLLDAAITELEEMCEQGEVYVSLPRNLLAELNPLPPVTRRITRENAPASLPVVIPPSTVPLPRQDGPRETEIELIRSRALGCIKCPHLVRSRKTVVFGEGNIHSPIMFIGEAPGAEEDEQGRPFVGRAGQLLTRIIEAMGFTREEIYITNILKCRPDTPGQLYGNRKPTPEEMRTCSPYVFSQIEVIKPLAIVALGATALEGLAGQTMPIGRIRGTWQLVRGVPVMPTYHPSYLLRSQSLGEKRKVWEDMLEVLKKLGRPITEKQKSFFTKP